MSARRVWVAVALAFTLGACDGNRNYSFEARFGEDVSTADVAAVTARIRREGCSGPILYEETFRRDDPAAMDVATLADGSYGFEAEARDDACVVLASGCRVLEMPEGEDSIVLTLGATAGGAPACDAAVCDRGECLAGAMDGGTDAADATLDVEETDAETPSAPTVIYPWNGIATGSATAVVGADGPVDHPLMPEVRWTEVEGAASYVLEMVRCEEMDLSRCNLDAPSTRVVLDGPPLRARPPSPLAVSDVVPVGARYAFRVGACEESGGRRCGFSQPRYVDVGRTRQDVDGDGDGELYGVTEDGLGATTLTEITGFESGDYAPVSLSISGMRGVYWIGDYDADGVGELIAATDGAPGGRLVYVDDLAESGAIDEPSAGAALGERVAGLGDVDGDGYADFAATVPGVEVRVQFGGPSWNPADGVVVRATMGLSSYASDIAPVGDRDGDGLADLAVLGRLAMDVGRIEVYSFATGAPRLIEMQDVGTGEDFGSGAAPLSLAGGFDVDGDGRPDIVVGQPLNDGVTVIFEGSRREIASIPGVEFGRAVAIGDIDGTGRARIVASDPLVVGPAGGGESGLVALVAYTGAPFDTLTATYLTPEDEHIGHELTVVDLNGDGLDDFFARAETGFLIDRLGFDTMRGGIVGQRLLLAPSGTSWKALTR